MTPSYVYAATVERVVDGDTLDVDLDLGMRVYLRTRLRLDGIDTPERGHQGYTEARIALATWAPPGSAVTVATSKPDKYGRALARVTVQGTQDLTDLLLSEGHGKPYSGGAR